MATKMNCLEFEVMRSKVKVMVRPSVIKKGTLSVLKITRSTLRGRNNLCGEGVLVNGLQSKIVQFC